MLQLIVLGVNRVEFSVGIFLVFPNRLLDRIDLSLLCVLTMPLRELNCFDNKSSLRLTNSEFLSLGALLRVSTGLERLQSLLPLLPQWVVHSPLPECHPRISCQ